MKRIGVIGIVIKGDRAVAVEMQKVLGDFGDIIKASLEGQELLSCKIK